MMKNKIFITSFFIIFSFFLFFKFHTYFIFVGHEYDESKNLHARSLSIDSFLASSPEGLPQSRVISLLGKPDSVVGDLHIYKYKKNDFLSVFSGYDQWIHIFYEKQDAESVVVRVYLDN